MNQKWNEITYVSYTVYEATEENDPLVKEIVCYHHHIYSPVARICIQFKIKPEFIERLKRAYEERLLAMDADELLNFFTKSDPTSPASHKLFNELKANSKIRVPPGLKEIALEFEAVKKEFIRPPKLEQSDFTNDTIRLISFQKIFIGYFIDAALKEEIIDLNIADKLFETLEIQPFYKRIDEIKAMVDMISSKEVLEAMKKQLEQDLKSIGINEEFASAETDSSVELAEDALEFFSVQKALSADEILKIESEMISIDKILEAWKRKEELDNLLLKSDLVSESVLTLEMERAEHEKVLNKIFEKVLRDAKQATQWCGGRRHLLELGRHLESINPFLAFEVYKQISKGDLYYKEARLSMSAICGYQETIKRYEKQWIEERILSREFSPSEEKKMCQKLDEISKEIEDKCEQKIKYLFESQEQQLIDWTIDSLYYGSDLSRQPRIEKFGLNLETFRTLYKELKEKDQYNEQLKKQNERLIIQLSVKNKTNKKLENRIKILEKQLMILGIKIPNKLDRKVRGEERKLSIFFEIKSRPRQKIADSEKNYQFRPGKFYKS